MRLEPISQSSLSQTWCLQGWYDCVGAMSIGSTDRLNIKISI